MYVEVSKNNKGLSINDVRCPPPYVRNYSNSVTFLNNKLVCSQSAQMKDWEETIEFNFLGLGCDKAVLKQSEPKNMQKIKALLFFPLWHF